MITIDVFSIVPNGDRKLTIQKNNYRVDFGNGNVQVQRKTINPAKLWELTLRGDKEWLDDAKAFFDTHGNGEQFYWTDEDGIQNVCIFNNDSMEITQRVGWDETGWGVKGFETTVVLRKVWGVS